MKNSDTKPARRTIAPRLAAAMAAMGRVPKRGRNDYHKYDYVTEADVLDAVRSELAAHGIAVCCDVVYHHIETQSDDRGKPSQMATVAVRVTLFDEDGDSVESTWLGQGQDRGDKALYKAYTGAMKYWALKTFLLGSGDDPEQESPAAPTPKKTATPKHQRMMAKINRMLEHVDETTRSRALREFFRSAPVENAPEDESVLTDLGQILADMDEAGRAKWCADFAPDGRELLRRKIFALINEAGLDKELADAGRKSYVKTAFGHDSMTACTVDELKSFADTLGRVSSDKRGPWLTGFIDEKEAK